MAPYTPTRSRPYLLLTPTMHGDAVGGPFATRAQAAAAAQRYRRRGAVCIAKRADPGTPGKEHFTKVKCLTSKRRR